MVNKNFEVSAFLGADTKTQATIVGAYAKALRYMQVHEAVITGEYRSWKNAMNIAENVCGDENFYLRAFYKQVDNLVRACKNTNILNRVPKTGSHKRALFYETEECMNQILAISVAK